MDNYVSKEQYSTDINIIKQNLDNYVSKEQYSTDIKKIKQNLDIIIALLNKFCKHSGVSPVSPVSHVSHFSDSDYSKMINALISNPVDYEYAIETFYKDNKTLLNFKEIKGISVDRNKLRIIKIPGYDYGPNGSRANEYYADNEVYNILNNLLPSSAGEISALFKQFLTDNTDYNIIHSATTTTTPTQKGFFSKKTGGQKNNKEYKSTKNKVNVIINKKSFIKTIYKNSNNVNYIKINKEYKLLSKFKVLTA